MSYHYYIATGGSPLTSWIEFYSTEEVEATNKLFNEERFAREELSDFKIQKSENTALYATLSGWYADSTKFSNEIGIEVYDGTRSSGTLYFKGYASVSDMKHDKERGWFSIVPNIDDDYRDIIRLSDVEYDIKGILTGINAIETTEQTILTLYNNGLLKYTRFDVATFVGSASGGDISISTAIDSSVGTTNECFFNIAGVEVGDKYIFTVSNLNKSAGVYPYIDILDDTAPFGSLTSGAQQVTTAGEYCMTILTAPQASSYLSINSGAVGNTSTFGMDMSYRKAEVEDVQAAKKWMDFLENYLTSYMGLTGFAGKVKSTFFNNDPVPTAGPATGFVRYTGDTFIISETELWCNGTTDNFDVSFSDIMSDVRETMQLYWYVDESGNFRVEHISWFERIFLESTGVVLTSSGYDKYRPFADSEEYVFNKGVIASREQFVWAQHASERDKGATDRRGNDIIYDELETITNIIKHELSRVTTDIKHVIDNRSDAAADGYMFLDAKNVCGSDYEVLTSAGILTSLVYENNHFSWSNLHNDYWTWHRMSRNGTMNGAATTFNTAVRFLENTKTFGYSSALDIFERIVTPQGNGFQLETKRNLDTDFLTIKLGYDPYA